MKKTLLLISIIFFAFNSFSQAPFPATLVHDPSNDVLVNLQTKGRLDQIRALQQDAQTMSFIEKTLKIAEDANKYRKQISKAIRTTKRIAVILESQIDLLDAYKTYGITMDFEDIMDYTSEQQREDIKKRYLKIIEESDKDIEELEQVITPGNMEMNDYERLEAINKIEGRMLRRAYSIKRLTNRVKASIRINKAEQDMFTMNSKLF